MSCGHALHLTACELSHDSGKIFYHSEMTCILATVRRPRHRNSWVILVTLSRSLLRYETFPCDSAYPHQDTFQTPSGY